LKFHQGVDMILLEYSNRILEETVAGKLENTTRTATDIICADFDGVTYHISTPSDGKNMLNVSINMKCVSELKKYGSDQILKEHYGNLVVAPETGYDATLQVNLDSHGADKDKLPLKIALLKRNLLSAPFKTVFDAIEKKGDLPNIIELKYREDEAMFIKPEGDRCIVIFSISFRDTDNIVIGKVFLQEFADARRSMTNVPAVTFSQKDPPLELKGVRGVKATESTGFVSIVLFPQHMSEKQREKTINLIQIFRNYFQYHIKCSKAYLHTRMRNRVESLLQILNRARPEPTATVARTITGKTFTRKV